MSVRRRLFDPGKSGPSRDLGLLVLRVGAAGSLLLAHGWGKVGRFGQAADQFADPLGIGSSLSMGLVIFAEVLCAVLVLVGLMGRLAALPLVINFCVAFFLHHAPDPFARKELALLYGLVFLALLATGPGRFSLDGLIRGR